MSTQILVCQGCNNREKVLGIELAANLIYELDYPDPDTEVKTVSCFGACNSFCTIAFKSEDKPTYIFGKLSPDNAAEIVALARVYSNASDGKIPWELRPPCLRNLIAVVPSVTKDAPELGLALL